MRLRQSLSVLIVVVSLALVVLMVIVVFLALVVLLILVVLLALAIVVIVIEIHNGHLLKTQCKYSLLLFRKTIHDIKIRRENNMLLIQNGLLYTMEDKFPIQADLLIKDGKIQKIQKNITPGDGMKIYNAEGMKVFPGFIDAHSHIGIAEEKTTVQTDTSNEGTTPVTPYLRAIDTINPMDSAFHNAVAAGITGAMAGPGSANPVGGQFAFIKTDGRRIDDMIVLAPSAIKIAFGENPMNNYGINGNTPSTRMSVASVIREELFRAREYFENDKNGEGEKTFNLECYRDLFDKKIPLKAHVHRADDIFTAIRIAKEFDLDLTLDHCTEGHLIADEIAESGFPAIVGPNLASRSKKEVSQSDFKTAGILKKAGVTVALTTDHPVSRIQHLPICAAMAAKEGLGEENALRAITVDAARICRVDNRLGSLKEGKDADIVILDGSPLLISSSVCATIINGKIVWEREQ